MKRLLLIFSLVAVCLQMSAQQTIINSMTMFQGTESGLYVSPLWNNINISPDINLRGVNTLRLGGGPLWVVDGVALNDSHLSDFSPLSFLNPYDIESVKVIKNISQTSVYGSRAGEGVIVINTAIPRDSDFGITYSGNAGVTLPVEGVQSSRTGLVTAHNLSYSGHQGKTSYGASGYYNLNQGPMKLNDQASGGLRAFFDTRANNFLWFGSNTACAIGNMMSAVPGVYLDDWSEDYTDEAVERRITNSTYVVLNFMENLKFNLNFGLDFHNMDRYIWYGEGTEVGKEENGSAFVTGASQFRYNADASLSWHRFFENVHKLSAGLSFEVDGGHTDYNRTGGSDFFSHYLKARGIGLAASDPLIDKYKYDYFTLGGVADLAYDYSGKAGIDALVRIDNTPRYDADKVRLYKSVNVFWDIHKSFFPAAKTLSSLRLNAGYGDAGKETPAPYGMYPLYMTGDYPQADRDIQMFYRGLNRLRTSEFNVSLAAGFLDEKLKFSLGYYDRMTNDSFISYCFGVDEGHYWRYDKAIEEYRASSIVANRGFEADLSAQIFKTKKFDWSLYANASYNVNQLLKVDALDMASRQSDDELTTTINVMGYKVGSYYGYKSDADGTYMDLTGEGVIDDYDKVILGNSVPEYFGGFGSTFRVASFSLDLQCSWAGGFEMLDLPSLYANEKAPYVLSDKYISAGDYFSLSKLAASYKFKFNQKKFVKGISISVSGINLLMTNKMYKTPASVIAGVSIHI